MRRRVATLPLHPPPGASGRGIVMPVGGRHIAGAWVSLTLLRRVHACRLPVEVWYLGDRDLPPAVRELLTEFNVRFVDATQGDPSLPPDVSGWVL
ncbi:MAG TPA: hypothetical protein VMU94_01915, partial [Streptosporangiaceae bacterium]|nr:hypothetical protein [Streptosporangiaceae bacterium]